MSNKFALLKNKVEENNGELLSKTYPGDMGMVKLRCANAHKFELTVNSVLGGTWCIRCPKEDNESSEEELCREVF
ncbi:Hypothetical protein ORPV_69 [Orpheovirus IHUMI-LCC2]|uniref:Uncharacterized protein n=1 Tax=Orpheovirus IHUMI-LCC2 TaxID=2023057 RepID=A0A2I2L373_9VIRU|nr:Hypothetical protein ORPV_69 [Orpheovirus IHUMI-LCC2]SNW61973.1 Hypothetical protein ORPV_69 [Orpheovirus IHUMI-LCC2]